MPGELPSQQSVPFHPSFNPALNPPPLIAVLCSSRVLHIMCRISARLTSSCCHWIAGKATALVVHPAAMWETCCDWNAPLCDTMHLPQLEHRREQSRAPLLHFQRPIEVWPVAYQLLRAGTENDLNGSSEAKRRLSRTAVSTKTVLLIASHPLTL